MRMILWIVLLLPVVINAQTECKVISANAEKGVYKIMIDGKIQLLVTKEVFDEAASRYESEISALEEQLTQSNALLDEYEQLRTEYAELTGQYRKLSDDLVDLTMEYKTASTDLVGLNDEYQVLVKDYDELAGKYRNIALHSSSNFKFHIGVGMNNSKLEERWDVFVGTGLFGFNGWIYGNTDRLGIAVGKTF
ncbi:hypothetical protein JXA70_11055 [candidate division KSB1 bacterium]|nr:hypothetical protein [candidate division KSB1 bacterium]